MEREERREGPAAAEEGVVQGETSAGDEGE